MAVAWELKSRIAASLARPSAVLVAGGCGSSGEAAKRRFPPRLREGPRRGARAAGRPARGKRTAAPRRHRGLRETDRGAARLPGRRQRLGLLVRPLPFEFRSSSSSRANYGKRVAFLGVDIEDSEDLAQYLLRGNSRPLSQLLRSRQRDRGEPGGGPAAWLAQNCLLRSRRPVGLPRNRGQYSDEAALRADIERCALGPPDERKVIAESTPSVIRAGPTKSAALLSDEGDDAAGDKPGAPIAASTPPVGSSSSASSRAKPTRAMTTKVHRLIIRSRIRAARAKRGRRLEFGGLGVRALFEEDRARRRGRRRRFGEADRPPIDRRSLVGVAVARGRGPAPPRGRSRRRRRRLRS